MNDAAVEVMKELPDLNIAYGVSDEYRSVLFSFIHLYEDIMALYTCNMIC